MKQSLREKKKTETRAAIYTAAMALFDAKGYAATTLSDIAESANISQRTIFAYFPSKEAIIFDPEQALFDRLFQHIENRGATDVFTALRNFHINRDHSTDSDTKREVVESSVALQEYFASMLSVLETNLSEAIALEKGLPLDSIQAQLVAAACRALVSYSIQNEHEQAVEIAFRFIEAGLQAARD